MQTLTVEEFRTRRAKEDPLVVNTLPEDAFRDAHIPESKNIPQSDPDFEKRVAEIAGGKERPVVVYCASAECDSSPKAAKKLEQAGFRRVYDFEGGLKAWKEAGGEVESGD
jgi:rhodanese-related sulfurtransferase